MDAWTLVVEETPHLAIVFLTLMMIPFIIITMMSANVQSSKILKGISEEDLIFSKLYKCVHQIGQKTMVDVVLAMYSSPLATSEGGTMLLRNYLENILHWSEQQIEKMEERFLDVNLMTQEFDISFAFRMINEVLPDIFSHLSDDCKDKINYLRILRNKISHKYGSANLDIRNEIDDLKLVLQNIYEGVGQALGIDFANNIAAMQKSLLDICNAKFRRDDRKRYLEDIQEFKKNKKHKMIVYGCKELVTHYQRFRVLNPCIWLTDPTLSVQKYNIDKIFTPLKIEDCDKEIDMANLLTEKKQIGDELKVPNALLLLGQAGCGKTSLCHYILRDWYRQDEKLAGLKRFDLVFLVEIRTVKSKCLEDYLTQQRIKETCKEFEACDIIPVLKELDVLFIIDGFDEANKTSKKLVDDIFKEFGNQRILLTTRNEYHHDAILVSRKHFVDYLVVDICGFDDVRFEEFTEKVFKAVTGNENECQNMVGEFMKHVKECEVPREYLRLPLTLALLIYLWNDNHDILNSVTSATSLYSELFRLCQKKLEERLCPIKPKSREVKELLLYLGEQAWFLLKSEYICINNEIVTKIKKKCQNEDVDEIQFMSAFLVCEYDEDADTNEYLYNFLHKTQMEYLAAGYLVNLVKKGKSLDDIKREVSDWQRYHEILIFLTGHLAKEEILQYNLQSTFKILDEAHPGSGNYNFWWKIFVEACRLESVGNIIVEYKLLTKHWQLDHQHVVSGLKFLNFTRVQLKSLKIEMPNSVNPYEVPDFFDTFTKTRWKLRGRHDKRNPILVELHFWCHNEYNCEKPSDDFLHALYPWGHLINFTGSLGKQEMDKEVLSYCFNLKTIRVRVNTPNALVSLTNSLLRIYKTVRQLRITLAFSTDCDPTTLAPVEFKGNLELTIPGIGDRHLTWLEAAIKQVGGRYV
ncbi:putative NACHT domain-containing protein 1 [Homarus americanus]|uniref:Putative NACHT domain-containing protein 1 n=1 Tax=Homarus americanus TaxID=6706 RepID=A0A8J5JZQ1_HOMAM|nr:putative NACHT domain-containing protein 1 [Homarus americanus]